MITACNEGVTCRTAAAITCLIDRQPVYTAGEESVR